MLSLAANSWRKVLVLLMACLATQAVAQSHSGVESVDPDLVIDGDLAGPQAAPQAGPRAAPQALATTTAQPTQYYGTVQTEELPAASHRTAYLDTDATAQPGLDVPASNSGPLSEPALDHVGQSGTYQQDDLVGAAEGLFGKGAKGLANVIEDILEKQGEPNGYIVGREGGGAFVFGARYGSGTLYHKVEGTRPVYWRGPSLGLDAGANAGNTFVLVYNLYDSEELFETFGQGEGQAYLIGGFHVGYLKRKDVVLVPVRMGAGLRLGVNVGYMKFSHKQRWFPF